MGKGQLPRFDEQATQPVPKAKQVDKLAPVPDSEGYIPRNVDVRMTRPQARILRDKLRMLQDQGATTSDGKHVTNRAQAIRWIIENEVQL